MIIVHTVDTIVNPEARMLGKFNVSVYVMTKINQVLIQSVFLEQRGWTVKFGQKCPYCKTPNTVMLYRDTIVCGRCERVYVMDNPKLQASGGRQIGSAK